MDFEARGLARHLSRATAGATDPGLLIRTVGLGSADLPGLEPSLGALRPAAVVVTGLAGGCAPDILPGEVIVGSPVGPTVRGAWMTPEARLMERAVRALRATSLPHRVGPLVTVRTVAATPQAKAELWHVHHALGVDMESAHVLDWATRAGFPALAVRAVADGPRDVLPPALTRAVSSSGALRPSAFGAWIAQPVLFGAAWRLWRRSRLALGHLARFLAAFTACQP